MARSTLTSIERRSVDWGVLSAADAGSRAIAPSSCLRRASHRRHRLSLCDAARKSAEPQVPSDRAAQALPDCSNQEYGCRVGRAFRLVSTGTDLRVPDVEWEIFDASELDDEDETVVSLLDYARAQGAVLALVEDCNGELAPIVVM